MVTPLFSRTASNNAKAFVLSAGVSEDVLDVRKREEDIIETRVLA